MYDRAENVMTCRLCIDRNLQNNDTVLVGGTRSKPEAKFTLFSSIFTVDGLLYVGTPDEGDTADTVTGQATAVYP